MYTKLSILLLILCFSGSLAAHEISINNITVTEKDGGAIAVFRLTLSEPAEDDSVTFFTVDGSALSGSDYTSTMQNVAFPEGALFINVSIPILGDNIPELNEVFYVRLTDSTATIDDGEGQCTIRDDDSNDPALWIDSVLLTEGDSGSVDAMLTVTLTGIPTADVTVNYSTSDGTATSGDYTTTSNILTIPLGNNTGTIIVPVIGDSSGENNEFLFVNLSNATNAVIVQGQGTVVIRDNDGTALFSALFDDGSLDPNWTFGPGWSEANGNLIGTNSKKTRAIASPIFAGCSQCSLAAPMQTSGGIGSKISLLAWYVDKGNLLEIMMREDADKWVIKLKLDAETLIKEKILAPILLHVDYQWFAMYDGSRILLFLDGTLSMTLFPSSPPQGTFGFQVKGGTGSFGEITVN